MRSTLGIFFLCSLVMHGQALTEITTEGPRPLDEALQKIEEHFRKPIFYEEIPHENAADLVPGSELGMNPSFSYLKWRKLKATIVGSPTFESAVNDTLAAYHTQGLPGAYSAGSYQGIVTVVPKTVTNVKGVKVDASPLLETKITLLRASRTRTETIAAILDIMSATSKRQINYLPFEPDIKKIVFGADKEPSASVLSRLQEEFGPFTCHLLYDPQTHQYYANFRWLTGELPISKPEVLGPRTNNPYFTLSK